MKFFARNCENNRKILVLYIAAAVLLVMAAVFGFGFGSVHIPAKSFFSAVIHGAIGVDERILIYVRLPRLLGCLIAGAALSVSGAVVQNVLSNRLASPSIIGVNSGAGLAVTLCAVFGVYGGWKLSVFAFVGAFVAAAVISIGACRWRASKGTVILMGVALNSLLNAFSDMIVAYNPDVAVMSNDFKMGDFSAVTYQKLLPALIIVGVVLVILFTLSNELDVLTMGEDVAKGLGMNSGRTRIMFLIMVALLSGCAVSLAGLLSFVGLIVPNLIRRIGVVQAKHLLPLCAMFGAGFVSLCDTVARTAFAPYEIPVGIIMAFLGAPFFVYILIKNKGGHRND